VVTYFCIINKIDPKDDDSLNNSLDSINIDFDDKIILLNGKDVSSEIREHQVSDFVSEFSSNIIIRSKLSELQRQLAKNKNVVIEGRDIGTNVFPDADFKFYLSAKVEVRAERRYNEMIADVDDISITKQEVLDNLIKRDELDMNRKHSPLSKGDDAIEIDTTNLNINEQVDVIIKTINKE
jgi:cytidylate kinase